MSARCSLLRGRVALQRQRQRRLERDLRDMAARIRALEIRIGSSLPCPPAAAVEQPAAVEDLAESGAPAAPLPVAAMGKTAKPRIKCGVTADRKAAPVPGLRQAQPERVVGGVAVRAPVPAAERIALPQSASAMEALFVPSQDPSFALRVSGATLDDGKIWCGPCEHRVPDWFGRDCITVGCPLKVRA